MFSVIKNFSCAVFVVSLFLNLPTWAQSEHLNATARAALGHISAQSLYRHLAVLGSDSLEGRGTGTRGGELAAAYITKELRKCGIKPAGDGDSYYQQIPLHGSKPLASSSFQFFTPNGQFQLALTSDYLLYNTGAQTFIPKPAPLMFVGYGIAAPEFAYNDYQALNVEGKIVVFLSGEPASADPSYFDGALPTLHSFPEIKQKIALARGAAGSIMIPTPQSGPGGDWRYWQQEFAFEDVSLPYFVAGNLSVVMNPQAAQRLFNDAPYSLQQIFAMAATNSLRSFQLPALATFRGSFQQRDFLAANVIGMLEGSDPELKNSYVVVSAHYDHLGIGPAVAADSIYNGVFDNAAGVAAVLEMAKAFAAMPEKPKRSLIFLFTTGEEKGLLGSTYYVENPVVPLYKTIANLNVDGLAMFDTFNDVVGVGAELSTLDELLQQVARELDLSVSPIPAPFANSPAFARSDQIAFAKAGIPALLIMEGTNYRNTPREVGLRRLIEWGRRIYHTPFDDLAQPINLKAAQQHSQILFAFCCMLANVNAAPQWKKGAPYINPRLQSIAEKR
jgi:Zn-dependent M28 family amino/carboxypeptidase